MQEMTCAEHDKYAASSQFLTHLTGRVLDQLDVEATPIDTKGYNWLWLSLWITLRFKGFLRDLYRKERLFEP